MTKRALIATVFNEADNLSRWWQSLMRQTSLPDEIVIVDGGSPDGTWVQLQELAAHSRVPVKLDQRRCNIAEGRNRAIQLTDAEIIAATDAGCLAEPAWFEEIIRPLLADPSLDVVGGHSENLFENEFQKFLERFEGQPPPARPEEVYPSSRNVAFRRQAWMDVGGYPEWLTLTAEDALFNFALHKIGRRFVHNPSAIVRWPVRETAAEYFKMLYSYGYGAAEAQVVHQKLSAELDDHSFSTGVGVVAPSVWSSEISLSKKCGGCLWLAGGQIQRPSRATKLAAKLKASC